MQTNQSGQEDIMRDEPPAFGLWLRRGLRSQFDAVLQEPVPAEFLALLEVPGSGH